MKLVFRRCVLGLLVLYPMSSRAQQSNSIDRTMQCGYLVAKANTVLTRTPRDEIEIVSQHVRLYNAKRHISYLIDLDQHFSSNKNLDGMKVLDNEAGSWFCFRSKMGKRYLYLMLTCINYFATSCKYDSEEQKLYDDRGHNLNIDKISYEQYVTLYKRLGLSTEPPDGGYVTDKHNIFFSQ